MTQREAFAFVAGGTVQAGDGIYLERHADEELLDHCRTGDFTYILTSRQMGKSSLMIRTAERLASEGAAPVIIDLTEFGAQATADQWYKGFLLGIQDQLALRTPAADWWDSQVHHSVAHRFIRYLREVALVERSERIVVFVDEIDTTLGLGFTDDFFAAIRFLYQNRAADPDLQRLSFVLIGVATPGDLIKDAARTPFNVGYRIDLTDFTLDEASPLANHLALPAPVGRDLIRWTLEWTGGHPYLTLRAIRSLAESPPAAWTKDAIDERIRCLFLRAGAGADGDSNLQFVRDMLTKKAFNREAVLRMYGRIRVGKTVPDKELDQVVSWLKLSGVVCRRDGALRVRNPIYDHVFDERWSRDHLRLHVNWRRRLTRVAAGVLVTTVLVTIPLAFYASRQKAEAERQAQEAEQQRDAANRQREIAETSKREAETISVLSEKAVDALKPFDKAAADAIGKQIATEREEAQKEIEELASRPGARADTSRKPAGTGRSERRDRAAPAPPAITEPPPTLTPDQAAIRKTLSAYEAAYASRDIDQVRRVQVLTAVEVKEITAKFAAARQYVVKIDKEDIKVSGDGRHAKVFARVNVRAIEGPSVVITDSSVRTFVMEKRGPAWIITAVQ